MTKTPITIRVPSSALRRADGLVRVLHNKLQAGKRRVDPKLVHAFAFKADERPFARRLLNLHARIWLFRCNQRAFAGDFVAVDMSSANVEKRRAWCLDLKLGAPVKLGGGGAGNAFVELRAAIEEIADELGVLTRDHEVLRATGDGKALVHLFGAKV